MKVILRALQEFTQGSLINVNSEIPDATWQSWHADTLANRLENKFVGWDTVREDSDPEDALAPEDMTRDQIADMAELQFGAKLDRRMSKDNMLQMLGAMKDRAAAAALAAKGPKGTSFTLPDDDSGTGAGATPPAP